MRCYARYLMLAVVAVLALGQLLAACGQKGPLYLPDEPPKAEEAR
jgi:predicted small lipoprotein YifL